MTCDIVPGSLGGAGSIPWCRTHNRYGATCEAVTAALTALRARVEWLPQMDIIGFRVACTAE